MSDKDNVHVRDEIGNMLLLDFLRKYRGSPAISTLTINELLREINKAELEISKASDLAVIMNEIDRLEGHSCVCKQAVDETVAVEPELPDQSGNIDFNPDGPMVVDDPLFGPDRDPPAELQKEIESAHEVANADTDHPDSTDAVVVASPEYSCFQGDPASLVRKTEPTLEQPIVPATEPEVQENILWKLKGTGEQNYNFVSFASLQKWIANLDNQDLLPISIDDGKTWKAFGEVMAIINASGGWLTPFKAFDVAGEIEVNASSAVEPEAPGVVETAPEAELASNEALEDKPKVSPETQHQAAYLAGILMSPPTPCDDYHWKLKAPNGLRYDFPTFESLSFFVKNSGHHERYLVSLSGDIWKDYNEFVAILESDKSFTPNGSFAITPAVESPADSSEQSVELDSQEVFDETPGDMELLDDEPVNSDQTDSSVEKPTQPEVTTAPVVTVVNEITWKLRGESERIYEFHGFSALQQGVRDLPDAPDKVYISLDGKEWKAYEQVNDLVINGVRLRDAYEVATPIRFRKPSLNGIPHVDLTKCEIRRDTVELLKREDCINRMIVPVAIHGGVLVVAVANSDDLGLVAYLENKYSYSISRVAAEEKQILNILETIYE